MQNKFIAINQFDGTVKLLKIELSTGNRHVIPAEGVDKTSIAFGLFEMESESETVALLATPGGPLLFLKDLQYRPEIGKTKIEVTDDGGFSHFQVFHDGGIVFSLFYKEKFGIGLHPYNNNREDIDFYYWLEKNHNDPKFYKVYTKEIHYLG